MVAGPAGIGAITLQIAGNRLYASGYSFDATALEVFGVDEGGLTPLAAHALQAFAAFAVTPRQLLVTTGAHGVVVRDLADPTRPRELARLNKGHGDASDPG